MFCTECGKENPDGAKFCYSCGAAFDQADATTQACSSYPTEGISEQSEPSSEVGRFCTLAITRKLLKSEQCEAVLQAYREEGIAPDVDSFIETVKDNGLCTDEEGLEQVKERALALGEPAVADAESPDVSIGEQKESPGGAPSTEAISPDAPGTGGAAVEAHDTTGERTFGVRILPKVILGMVLVAALFWAFILRPAFQQAQEKSRRINCAGNLKQIGLALRMYSGDHGDHFPPDFAVLIQQDYLTTKKVYTCPSTSTLPATDLNQFLTEDHCDYLYFGAGLIEDCEGHPPGQTIIACDDFANHVGAIKDKAVIVLFADGRVRIVGGINAIEDLAGRQGLFLPTGERREDGALIPQPSEASSNVTVDQRTDTASSAGEDLTTPETPSAETNTPTAPETAAISFSDLCSFPTQLPESFDRSRLDRKIVSTNEEVKPSAISLVIQAQSGGIPLKLRTDGSFDLPLDVALQRENPWVVSNQPKGTLRVQCTAFGQEIEKKKAEERRRRKRAVIESAQRTVNSRWRYNPESGHYRSRHGCGAISKAAYQRKVRALAESWYNGAVDWIWYQDF